MCGTRSIKILLTPESPPLCDDTKAQDRTGRELSSIPPKGHKRGTIIRSPSTQENAL